MAAEFERVPSMERNAYQKAARTLLMFPLISEIYPNADALPLVRRWATALAEDLAELFDYRLELTPTTARLRRVADQLHAGHPALTATASPRPFDRRRYAYLTLTVAVLGRSGTQLALSELAQRVAGETARIDGLELSPEKASDRGAFVDAVSWLEIRGALRLADGNAKRWADDPSAGEALYDIDRDVVRALYRPTRVLQHLDSVTALMARPEAVSRDSLRLESAQRVRRALVEQPVVYYDALNAADRGALRNPGSANDVAEFTGMAVERRSEGVALLDISGSFSDRRFPGPGTVTQVALLLANAIADRVLDVDAPDLIRLTAPDPDSVSLAARLDLALPRSAMTDAPTEREHESVATCPGRDDDGLVESATPVRHPLLEHGWLQTATAELIKDFGGTFAAAWVADPDRLLTAALGLLAELSLVAPVPGGILALPLLARYRNARIEVNRRADRSEVSLFDV
jgi:uncharacterized protein (TIGR02678 family)